MKEDSRTAYAQSSDIKGRSYLEYRRDMKRKAIAELEALGWIQRLFESMYPNENVSVTKSGGDRFLWFLRQGGISREPDYVISIGDKIQRIEFQYAATESLSFYDFKLSKVTKRRAGRRIPREDVLFLYIDKPRSQYALLSAEWIVENAKVEEVPAWRSPAYRVPVETFRQQLRDDDSLATLVMVIDAKNTLLEFQHALYEIQKDALRERVEQSIATGAEFVIAPDSMDGFYEACFILQALQRQPENAGLWLQRAVEFARQVHSLKQIFWVSFSLDFLYFCVPPTQPLDITSIIGALSHLTEIRESFYRETSGAYLDEEREPCMETRYALFTANVTEDMIQDILHYRVDQGLNHPFAIPIRRIYQSLHDPIHTARFVQEHCRNG